MPGHRRLPIPRPRPTRPVVTLPIDPLVQALKDHTAQLHQAGVSLRLIADGARIPHSTLSDLMAGRRVHLTVADARALAGYLHYDIVLARLPLVPTAVS
jgi:hypothetical protein